MKRLLAAGALLALIVPAPAHAAKPRCNKTVKVVTGDDAEGNLFFRKRRVTIHLSVVATDAAGNSAEKRAPRIRMR